MLDFLGKIVRISPLPVIPFFKQKRGHREGKNPNNFSRKIRHDLSLGYEILKF
jgi:hypothetical protein